MERLEREKIEEVSRIKTQFFTNISHELRTPLTLILTPLEQLIKEHNSKKNQQLYTVMHHNAARLHTMINQFLTFASNIFSKTPTPSCSYWPPHWLPVHWPGPLVPMITRQSRLCR